MIVLIAASMGVAREKNESAGDRRSVFFIVIEMLIEKSYFFLKNIMGDLPEAVFSLLLTFFMFIILGNWIGLLPGVGSIGIYEHLEKGEYLVPLLRSPNADLNTTFALALISVGSIQYLGIKSLGFKDYLSKFINIKSPIKFFVGILELISEFAKILSFSFRLFGNIFAGEVLLGVMVFLIPVLVPVPFLALEVFVGFIQALVFTMLTAILLLLQQARLMLDACE
jgi:F-type H+-transporting ATPase subunit a